MSQSKYEMCKGQRTTRSQLFPSTLWVLEPEFGSSVWQQVPLHTEPSCPHGVFLNSLLVYCI